MISPFADRAWSSALAAAMRWHAGQTRKSTGLPYVVHCIEVAANLERLGLPEPVVIAGLLHDTLEDTAMDPNELSRSFGREVFEIVIALTERKLDEQGRKRPWIDRKREHIRHLRHSGPEIRVVALADQRQNLTSVLTDWKLDDPAFWSAFNAAPGDFLEYHRRRCQVCQGDEPGVRELSAAVSGLIGELADRLSHAGFAASSEFTEVDWA